MSQNGNGLSEGGAQMSQAGNGGSGLLASLLLPSTSRNPRAARAAVLESLLRSSSVLSLREALNVSHALGVLTSEGDAGGDSGAEELSLLRAADLAAPPPPCSAVANNGTSSSHLASGSGGGGAHTSVTIGDAFREAAAAASLAAAASASLAAASVAAAATSAPPLDRTAAAAAASSVPHSGFAIASPPPLALREGLRFIQYAAAAYASSTAAAIAAVIGGGIVE
jgi:hypothetical protein